MSEVTKNTNGFIGYEYKDITVKRGRESVYADGYANFGWALESTTIPIQNIGSVTMKFKRDRKIRNKAELSRLQRQFESDIVEIEGLESSKTIGAYSIGIIGVAFIAGSVFAYNAGLVPLSIILAIPGFIAWIIPYFSYLSFRKKKTEQTAPLIDQKYDEIYEACKKANGLLAA